MKRLVAIVLVLAPTLAAADAFDEVNTACRMQNSRYGYILVESFCSCLDAELRKRVTEGELADFLHRPPSPEDEVVDAKGEEAGRVCREKIEREFKSI